MPTQEEVTQAQNTAYGSAQNAASLASGQYSVESEIKKALQEAYDYNQDIVEPLDEATSTYLSSPSAGRDRYQDIFNPFARERLVSQYVGNKSIPMLALSNIMGARTGSIADTIKAGTGAYQANVSAAQNQAALDRQIYQDLLNQFQSDREYQLELQKANKDTTSPLDILKELLPFAKQYELSSEDEEKLDAAKITLDAIESIKNADDATFRTAATNNIFGMLGRSASADARTLRPQLLQLTDLLQRSRSGAALTEEEQKLYSAMVSGDPLAVMLGYREGSDKALEILGNIAQKNYDFLSSKKQTYTNISSPVENYFNNMALDAIYGY